jgi:peptidyl-prolyl cis-trans isomerase SurA
MTTSSVKRTSHSKIGAPVLLVLALALPATAGARTVERIVAVVGEEVILESEINERARPAMQEISALPDPGQRAQRAAAVRREVLERIIEEHLLLQQADELKLSVTSEEIDRSIEQIKKDYGLTDAQLADELRKQGMNVASYRQSTRKEILRYRVLNIAVGSKVQVSDNDVQSYYERNMKSGSNLQVKVSHIFVAIPENADAAKVLERERYAKKILARAQAGEDFAGLAKELSEDPATRAEGGDLGYFGKEMGLPKPVEELVFSMKVGEVGGPVRGNQGFHVIKLVDRRAKDIKPLGEVKEELRGRLRQKEMERQTKAYLAELRRKTLVDIRTPGKGDTISEAAPQKAQ